VTRETIEMGTTGWKAPEVCAPLVADAGQETQAASSTPLAGRKSLLEPAKAEMFSFGLLVSYILLGGVEPFRLPKISAFLLANYGPFCREDNDVNSGNGDNDDDKTKSRPSAEEVATCTDRALIAVLQQAQQWMICRHLDVLVDGIVEALDSRWPRSKAAKTVTAFVRRMLSVNPTECPSSFVDICRALGGDPDETRHR
jgi:serine/threonine protein kinase